MSVEKKEFSPNEIKEIAIQALNLTFLAHENLGALGEALVEKNQFGDTALRMDVEAEKAVITALEEAGIPIIIHSEEHGIVKLGNNPQYLGVLDGLDGSDEYKRFRGSGRYGTMLGIFSNPDPLYGDYIFQGIMEHASKRLFYATKNQGAFMKDSQGIHPIQTSGLRHLDNNSKVYFTKADFDRFGADKSPIISALQGISFTRIGSTASHYADLVSGKVDLLIEPTRKGNLELGAACGLVFEAKGVVSTLSGIDLRQQRFLEFGQKESLAIIAAATTELFDEVLKRTRKSE